MAMRVPVYFVVKGSGQFGPDGVEFVMILEAKLSRHCAEVACGKYEGATIMKMVADKEIPLTAF